MEKCPRCNKKIICLSNDIENCACNERSFNEETIAFVQKEYASCLCNECLLEISLRMKSQAEDIVDRQNK